MPCFRARKSSHSKHRAGAGCFPTFFSFKLDQPAQEREEDAALASPLCRWLPGLSLSPSCPDAVLLSLSPDRWFWPGWGLNWSPPSSSRPLCLCSLCCWTGMSHHGWGTQRLCCWADFPSGSPGSGWSLHTGAPMPAEQRGGARGTPEDTKEKGERWPAWAAGPKLQRATQSPSPHVPSSPPWGLLLQARLPRTRGGYQGALASPSHRGGTGDLQHRSEYGAD